MLCPICSNPLPADAKVCRQCGWTRDAGGDALPPGTRLKGGAFEIESTLGQGGFGITYSALDTALRRRVAIKELFPSGWRREGVLARPPGNTPAGEVAELLSGFMAEAQTLASLNHPGIVRIHSHFPENGTAYLVMEYLEGQTLGQPIAKSGGLATEQVTEVARAVAGALEHIHGAGLLHRDLKPDNIFLTKDGRVVLIDFGSVRSYAAGKTVSHTRLVTPGYAPLEQYGSSGKFGPYTDLYALGATLHHALTGVMPPPSTDLVQGMPLPALPASTPAGLRRAVESAMTVKVADRPQTAGEFLRLLTGPPGPVPVSPLPPGSVPSASHVGQLWQNIEAVPAPTSSVLVLPNLPSLPTRISDWTLAQSASLIIVLGSCAGGVGTGNLTLFLFGVAGFLVIATVRAIQKKPPDLNSPVHQLAALDRKLQAIKTSYDRGDALERFRARRAALEQIRDTLLSADQIIRAREQSALADQRRAALELALRNKPLRAGVIPGVGEQRVLILRQHGIRTALDIEDARLYRITGFGPTLISNLRGWRREMERQATASLPKSPDLRSVRSAVVAELAGLENQLANGPRELQAEAQLALTALSRAQQEMQALLAERERVFNEVVTKS